MGKTGPDRENSRKYLTLGEKIVEIGPVDTDIALLILKEIKKNKLQPGRQVCRAG